MRPERALPRLGRGGDGGQQPLADAAAALKPVTVCLVTAAIWAANLLVTGLRYTTVWSRFVSATITGTAACVLYLAIDVRAVDGVTEVRGTLVSLVSASAGLGSALGALCGGLALAVFGDYASVYRLLGIILLASAVILTFAAGEEQSSNEWRFVPRLPAWPRRIESATTGAG